MMLHNQYLTPNAKLIPFRELKGHALGAAIGQTTNFLNASAECIPVPAAFTMEQAYLIFMGATILSSILGSMAVFESDMETEALDALMDGDTAERDAFVEKLLDGSQPHNPSDTMLLKAQWVFGVLGVPHIPTEPQSNLPPGSLMPMRSGLWYFQCLELARLGLSREIPELSLICLKAKLEGGAAMYGKDAYKSHIVRASKEVEPDTSMH
jgi:hypothetical protein